MKLNVGDYVRTKYGITQYKEYDTLDDKKILCMPIKDGSNGIFANIEDIIKSSPNIIDLIEINDYINGSRVEGQDDDGWLYLDTLEEDECQITELNQIKTIVTKEQFEQMEYKIN